MLTTENTIVTGFEAAVRGMRNPLNSWAKSDSHPCDQELPDERCDLEKQAFCLGNDDYNLMQRLIKAGKDHAKFMRFITVTTDIVAPLYWWKEFDTYKVGTVANSCSTMHTIHKKPFNLDDFSTEYLNSRNYSVLDSVIVALNAARRNYLESKSKLDWWQMIQLLPSSYNQRRTVMLNYQVLQNIYHARKDHKLDEWHTLCAWIERLPYSQLITGGDTNG